MITLRYNTYILGPLGGLSKIDTQSTQNSAYNIRGAVPALPNISFTNTGK